MTHKVVNRQIVNICADLRVAGASNQNIQLNLRFPPDEVIVRQISFNNDVLDKVTCQLYFDLALDLYIGTFPLAVSSSTPNTKFLIKPNWISGVVNLQVQTVPSFGTGSGIVLGSSVTLGELCVILEFVQYAK